VGLRKASEPIRKHRGGGEVDLEKDTGGGRISQKKRKKNKGKGRVKKGTSLKAKVTEEEKGEEGIKKGKKWGSSSPDGGGKRKQDKGRREEPNTGPCWKCSASPVDRTTNGSLKDQKRSKISSAKKTKKKD